MASDLVEKMRAFRAELIERDRDEVTKRFAEYVYYYVTPYVKDGERARIFYNTIDMESCFDRADKRAREWLLNELEKDGLIEIQKEEDKFDTSVWLTHKGAMALCA